MAVWTDNVKDIMSELENLQEAMMDYVWLDGDIDNRSAEEAVVEKVYSRPTWHQSPLSCGLTVGLNVFIQALGIRESPLHSKECNRSAGRSHHLTCSILSLAGKLMTEYYVDGGAMRFLIILSMPFLFCVVHFFLVRPPFATLPLVSSLY